MYKGGLIMKKLTTFLSVLAAALLLSALPAFSGSGPYGAFGPSDVQGMNQGIEHQVAFSGGTGPYGGFGPYAMDQWSESHQVANKDECLLVARNCPPEMAYTQHRIDRLNTEIAKGTDVYTPAELNVLNDKLNAAYEELNRTNSGY
jgi:hypothetical protein